MKINSVEVEQFDRHPEPGNTREEVIQAVMGMGIIQYGHVKIHMTSIKCGWSEAGACADIIINGGGVIATPPGR
jgi:hypothetical protein